MGHVSVQEFLNTYNALDNYLRDICGGDESKGMISLYKDTLTDPSDQMQLKTINKLRNDIVHGVFSTDEPIKVDKSFIKLLNKHLKYVKHHQAEVKKAMLVAMSKRREKDEMKAQNVVHSNVTEERVLPQNNKKRKLSSIRTTSFPVKKIYISNMSGILSIEDSDSFYCDYEYKISGESLKINNNNGIGRLCLPPGHYDLLLISDSTGQISVTTVNATFEKISKTNFSGILDVN